MFVDVYNLCCAMLHDLEMMMANPSVFTVLERNYLKLGLAQLRSSIVRSIAKEANPEIVRLKNEDIKAIDALEAKVGVM